MIFIQIIYYYITYSFLIDSTTTFFHESKLCNNLTSCKNVSLQILISSHPGNEWTESTLQFRTYKKINNKLRQKRSFNPTVATTVNNNTKILNNNLPSNVSIWTIQPNILRAHMMLLPYKSRHLLRKKSVFLARTGRSVIQFYNKLAAVYWLPMFWPRRRPGTDGTHFVSMSGPTVHPYTVAWFYQVNNYPKILKHIMKL